MDIRIVSFENNNKSKIRKIRTSVFVEEQGIDSKVDFDGLDEVAAHVLVCTNDNAVATGRVLEDGHIGRIAVLKEFRGVGVGASVVKALIKVAKKKDFSRVYLGSQTHAIGFYEKLGFKVCSEVFIDADLEHVEMEMLL